MRTSVRLLPFLLSALACARPAVPVAATEAAEEPGPTVRVEASYPGADARVVADTVSAQIEQIVHGVAGMTALESESRADGTYTLVVRFKPKTDLNEAISLVRNRVKLAEPQLPEEVRRQGVKVHRGDPEQLPVYWVAVTGADAARLAGLAELRVRPELLRIPGITGARLVGTSPSAARVWLDPERLAARGLTTEDVVLALETRRLLAGPRDDLRLEVRGDKPADLKAIEATVLLERGGAKVFLRDVARLEVGTRTDGFAVANGKPAAVLAVTADAGDSMSAAIRKTIAGIDVQLPKGMQAELAADLTAGGFGVVELRLPDSADRKRTREAVDRAVKSLGAAACVAFSDAREPNAATLLVKPYADARKVLTEIREATVRVSDLASGRPFPVRVALADTGGHGYEELRKWGDAVVKKLAADGVALDPAVFPGPPAPRLNVRIDREKMTKLGVRVTDITEALQAHVGGIDVGDYGGFGRTLEIRVDSGNAKAKPDDLKQIKVRAAGGTLVTLGNLVEFRVVDSPPAILRVNTHPAVRITAAVPPGQTLADVRAKLVTAVEAAAPKGGKVFDLSGTKPR